MSSNDFGFPFEPYDVQINFMNSLIETLHGKKIGLFESPTGTGKSMSLLCGSLTWLREHQKETREELEKKAAFKLENSTADDWLLEQTESKQLLEEAADARSKLQRMEKHLKRKQDWEKKRRKRRREDDDNEELMKLLKAIKKNVQSSNDNVEDETDDDLILDYQSEEEESEPEEDEDTTKIYYCSRTHSQLSQFVQEVKRSSFGKDVRLVSLASRESLCINEAVRGLHSLSLMNERCLDMQKKKETSKGKNCCSFKNQDAIEDLLEGILSEVQDVEELANNARTVKACPYYAARKAIPEAELIVLPYNTLLHAGTREASGLRLKNSVVIIDEAHNLMETIIGVHSVRLSGQQVSRSHAQLNQYFSRYKNSLNPQNLLYVKQVLFVLEAFLNHLKSGVSKNSSKELVLSPMDFLTSIGVDNINIFKLIRYCDKSHIGRKLHGFSSQIPAVIPNKPVQSKLTNYLQKLSGNELANNDENEDPKNEGSPFVIVQEFLRALTITNRDGRIISTQAENLVNASLRFLLLNPALPFQSIVLEARAVVLAGGTMHPHSEFIDRLLIPSGVPKRRIQQFSCGHVVPKENLLALALSKGPGDKIDLDFTFGSRGNAQLIEEAGCLILNLSALVPGGMVVFFPSYDYEQLVYSAWESSGLLLRLSERKRVFREPRKSSQVDSLLTNYAKSVFNNNGVQKGAILLSVVGGKMSEGINFSDDLARCVIMLGLPFPNVHSVEFKEKSTYLDTNQGSGAGGAYGLTLCMRAVNQSIGRAIRHKADYAVVVLLDLRYKCQSVQSALPAWIAESLQKHDRFGSALASVKKFFALHKSTCDSS